MAASWDNTPDGTRAASLFLSMRLLPAVASAEMLTNDDLLEIYVRAMADPQVRVSLQNLARRCEMIADSQQGRNAVFHATNPPQAGGT